MAEWYPLGDKKFRITHNGDEGYDTFFHNLGRDYIYIVYRPDGLQGPIGATCALVLRTINGEKVWYICDAKVAKKYRGHHLTWHMFVQAFLPRWLGGAGAWWHSIKFYGICMDPTPVPKFSWILRTVKLYFYIFDTEKFKDKIPQLHQLWGSTGIVAETGKKIEWQGATGTLMYALPLLLGQTKYSGWMEEDTNYILCMARSQLGETNITATIVHPWWWQPKNWNWVVASEV